MAFLLKYALDTGTIVGVWESHTLTLLEAQRVVDDPVYGYLLWREPLDVSTVEEAYQVMDGALVARATSKEGV